MNNLLGNADQLSVSAPTGGYTSGQVYAFGNQMVGVASETVAAGELVNLNFTGRYSTDQKIAATGEAWIVGRALYLTTGGTITVTEAGSVPLGVAVVPAVTGATTGEIMINVGKGT